MFTAVPLPQPAPVHKADTEKFLVINAKTRGIREKAKRDRQIETRRKKGHREGASSLESAEEGTGNTR